MELKIKGVESGSDLDNLFKAAGFIVVQWGHCEQSLELLVHTLFNHYGGCRLVKDGKMPRELSKKIKFVKKCIIKIPELATFNNELEYITKAFEEISQTRHNLIHGALVDVHATNDVFTFVRLDTKSDAHEDKYSAFDLNHFPSLLTDLLHLGCDVPKIAKRILDACPKNL